MPMPVISRKNLVETIGIDTDDLEGAIGLKCPRCGFDYLRHIGVIVYDRATEDDARVNETTVHNGIAELLVTNGEHNPSDRRSGLAVRFSCEGCSDNPQDENEETVLIELTLSQHKGSEFIGWRFTPLPTERSK